MHSDDARDLWSVIFNAEERHSQAEHRQRACKVFINEKLQFHYMEGNGDTIWAGRRRVALDVWIERLAALLSLHAGCEEP